MGIGLRTFFGSHLIRLRGITMLTKQAKGLMDVFGYYPMLATVVTAKSRGRENAMAVAWHAIVSTKPPAYGISVSPKRFTHGLITESGTFGVNFLPGDEAGLIAAVGGCSGRDVDKFRRFRIEKVNPIVHDLPILKSAYFAMECEVTSKLTCGDHDWFVGRVAATHWSESAFDLDRCMKFREAMPTVYMGQNRYLVIRKGRKMHLDRKECIARRTQAMAGKPRT
jgi:flavin reductase (DIM6/NTAB) family NADH-FMN oxidoreductase RutF